MNDFDAAFDLRAAEDIFIYPEDSKEVSLGVAFLIPPDLCGVLSHRSSLAFHKKAHISYGLIDASFDGEVKAFVFNTGSEPLRIRKHQRIAQIRFVQTSLTSLVEGEWEPKGKEGFGSSGAGRNQE